MSFPAPPPHSSPGSPAFTRRRALGALLAIPAVGLLSACGGTATAGGARISQGALEPLAASVPAGTTIKVGDPSIKVALELSGLIKDLDGFTVEFANISGGPQTTEAFRANALDAGSVADVPPIHATWTGLDVRIIAAGYRQDAVNHPIYELGVAPGAGISRLEDLRGKKVAYSPGQAQGALVLRILDKAGLRQEDVKLVELPSTGDAYATALASKQVDAAPLGGVQIKRYLAKYKADGATTIRHGLRDDPSLLYSPAKVLADPAKAAALAAYVKVWGKAQRWIEDHPAQWLDGYYVKDQGLSREDGQYLIDATGKRDLPTAWTEAIARHQETIDLLAREQKKPQLTAADLYDTRFEAIAGTAFAPAGKAGAA
ncbi:MULTISPECIES: ABC transporter substrate-binding protein [unclassified Arthrobacter]|uniref:ABC transporter substrate-binding protein n=1 Tax=unclassified Arthrobacter TaxID=235627 RepID=UPI00035D4C59|nr:MULTISPECIES: ABC transporter substrate-binding protein [unclassified Arthrobacter]BCW56054.1 nitrate ABC transporter substrate-binding protein [Arthrobacter sp. StoSoilB19]